MNNLIRSTALAIGLVLGVASACIAEEYDFNAHALESLQLSIEKYGQVSPGKPSKEGLKEHAALLMLVKNALSLKRDGYLKGDDADAVAGLIKAELDYTSAVLATADGWPVASKQFLRAMHYHALAAEQLISMQSSDPHFNGLMAAYHSGIGSDAYRAARDAGIEQRWDDAP